MTVETTETPLYQQYSHMDQRIKEAAQAQDLTVIEAILDELTSSTAYHNALAKLIQEEAVLEQLQKEYNAAKDVAKMKRATEEQHEAARLATLAALEQHERVSVLKAQLDVYRRNAAAAAQHKAAIQSEKERAAGTFLEFTEKAIGKLVSKGHFKDGSTSWLKQRTTGIGGSDVGPILKVGEKKYQYENYRAIIDSKLNPNYEATKGDPLLSATGRGHAWEDHLRQVFAARHPELNVWYAKDSFEHVEKPWVKANFDGLLSPTTNAADVDGLLEIKTSSRPQDWGPEHKGYEGIPKNYFYQMLWYMVHAGLDYGHLIVSINDHEIRTYSFRMDDAGIEKHVHFMLMRTAEFWEEEILNYQSPASQPKRSYNWMTPAGKQRALDTLAALAHAPVDDILTRGLLHMEDHDDFLDNVAALIPQRDKPFIVVDIETSSASPAYGRVVELSIVRLDSFDSEPVEVFDARFGLPKDVLSYVGVNMTEIHRIEPHMLHGAPLFDDPAIQQELMDIFKQGTVVAHNKQFETRFFTAFLEGFGTALRTGEIVVLDTMDLMKLAMPETPNNRLEGFAEWNGIPYVDAHAALADTMMTAEALAQFLQTIHEYGTWLPTKPTEEARIAALKAAQSTR